MNTGPVLREVERRFFASRAEAEKAIAARLLRGDGVILRASTKWKQAGARLSKFVSESHCSRSPVRLRQPPGSLFEGFTISVGARAFLEAAQEFADGKSMPIFLKYP